MTCRVVVNVLNELQCLCHAPHATEEGCACPLCVAFAGAKAWTDGVARELDTLNTHQVPAASKTAALESPTMMVQWFRQQCCHDELELNRATLRSQLAHFAKVVAALLAYALQRPDDATLSNQVLDVLQGLPSQPTEAAMMLAPCTETISIPTIWCAFDDEYEDEDEDMDAE